MRSGRVPVLSDFQLRWLVACALCMPSMVWAHTGGEGSGGSFLYGVTHPFSGGDHLLAMLAVGLWAAQNGGRWLWSLPAVFVTLMLAGATAALAGWGLPYAEQAVVASLFLFGLMVAGACPAGAVFGVLLVGAFAVFHGFAHGAEIPATSDAFSYALGFLLSTAFLHGAGIGFAALLRHWLTRLVGAGIALSGVFFVLN